MSTCQQNLLEYNIHMGFIDSFVQAIVGVIEGLISAFTGGGGSSSDENKS